MQLPVSSFKAQLASFRIAAFAMIVSVLASAALTGCDGAKASGPPPKPPEVDVVQVVQKDVPITSEWTATLDGFVNAQIQPRVSGYLVK
ncbi:MAG TPA: efflux transporter periplasmic adaptor subunit, partial [Candidatus Angelobacter sp.]|nr:efflux transporter periplasmic adaptor subunit [Candidatus Angelobacter sp.]